MNKANGVAEHPEKVVMEKLWRSGLRAKGIVEYLDSNGLPGVSYKALSKYGQRNWNDKIVVKTDTGTEPVTSSNVEALVQELEDLDLGRIERISVSKTGFNISMKPFSDISELENLPTVNVGGHIPVAKAKNNYPRIHIVIPDTQCDPGRGNDHLLWISQFIKDEFSGMNVILIHLGDHWNMGSLSSYDRGKGVLEGRRFVADIEAGNRGFEILESQIADEPFERHFLFGNHEDRINRLVNDDVRLEGLVSLNNCITPEGWQRHGYLEPVTIDGVTYAHYFYNPNTGKPYGGESIDLRLKAIGHSFVMGHQQGYKMAQRYDARGIQQVGVVAGSCYTHEEPYRGPQANAHWNGIVVLNNVKDGSFDPWPISLDSLCEKYEGHSLAEHTPQVL